MDGHVQLIPRPLRDTKRFALAEATLAAVFLAAGRSVIVGSDDLVIFNDDCAVSAAYAGRPACDGFAMFR